MQLAQQQANMSGLYDKMSTTLLDVTIMHQSNLTTDHHSNAKAMGLLLLALSTAGWCTTTVAQSAAEAEPQTGTGAATQDSTNSSSSKSHRDLSTNECLKQLNDADQVIASIAFKDGLDSAEQFKELVRRRPWGVGTFATADEIKSQLKTQSPFLIITLTKKQALTLDDHRDIIRWVLVQSINKPCK